MLITSKIYEDSKSNAHERFSNYKNFSTKETMEEVEELEDISINMTEIASKMDKRKNLKSNREKIVDIIHEDYIKYLDLETYNYLCDSLDLDHNDVEEILIEKLNLEEIYYIKHKIFVNEEYIKPDIDNDNNNNIPNLVESNTNVQSYLENSILPDIKDIHRKASKRFK